MANNAGSGMKLLTIKILALILFCSLSAQAKDDWQGFDYRDYGITAAEYQKVRENNMSRKRLLILLEYGIMPSEYFSEPWKKLGISEPNWVKGKKQGLEDGDMDRTLYTNQRFNFIPIYSFFAPGYYQYKTDRPKYGATLTTIAVAGLALSILDMGEESMGSNLPSRKYVKPMYPIIAGIAMMWSAADAYMGTRYVHNHGAKRFALVIPADGPPQALLTMHF